MILQPLAQKRYNYRKSINLQKTKTIPSTPTAGEKNHALTALIIHDERQARDEVKQFVDSMMIEVNRL